MISVTIINFDGRAIGSYYDKTFEIEIVGDVVTLKAKGILEEYHSFPFIVREVKEDG
ncbi:MAG: hypothetical protein ACP5NC_02255 [Nitrososphaeria archaeon]